MVIERLLTLEAQVQTFDNEMHVHNKAHVFELAFEIHELVVVIDELLKALDLVVVVVNKHNCVEQLIQLAHIVTGQFGIGIRTAFVFELKSL